MISPIYYLLLTIKNQDLLFDEEEVTSKKNRPQNTMSMTGQFNLRQVLPALTLRQASHEVKVRTIWDLQVFI